MFYAYKKYLTAYLFPERIVALRWPEHPKRGINPLRYDLENVRGSIASYSNFTRS